MRGEISVLTDRHILYILGYLIVVYSTNSDRNDLRDLRFFGTTSAFEKTKRVEYSESQPRVSDGAR